MQGAGADRHDYPVVDVNWGDVSGWFDPDCNGVLPDVCVSATSIADWQVLLDLVRAAGWAVEWSVDGAAADVPDRAEAMFDGADDSSRLLQVRPVPEVLVNFFPYAPEEIGFDVDLRELQGQERLDILCAFLRTVGRALGKQVVMTAEGMCDKPILVYEPDADRIVLTATSSGRDSQHTSAAPELETVMVDAAESTLEDLIAGSTEDVWRFTDAVGDERALACARQWIGNGEGAVREVGVMVLGQTALNHSPALEALIEYAAVGCVDTDVDVRVAVAQALGNQSAEARCVPWLLRLLDDPDIMVRRLAIGGLPIVLDEPAPDHPAVRALLGVLTDPAPVLRDWAAFALGTQLQVDSPEIRAGLRSLLGEPATSGADPAAEAAAGLALRADPEVYAAIADRLTHPAVGSLWLQAAAELADQRLLPVLLALRSGDNDPDDPWVQHLEGAISRCDRSAPPRQPGPGGA